MTACKISKIDYQENCSFGTDHQTAQKKNRKEIL